MSIFIFFLICIMVAFVNFLINERWWWWWFYITARWKFCSRFIYSRPNVQYLPSYGLIC